jgi:hypothetical protein
MGEVLSKPRPRTRSKAAVSRVGYPSRGKDLRKAVRSVRFVMLLGYW